MKTLWLASWYPNKLSPFNGDFIRRHAEAVSEISDVKLFTIERDRSGEVTRDWIAEEQTHERLSETIIYYYSKSASFKWLDKFFAEAKSRRVYKAVLKKWLDKNRPDLVHVHVGLKAGIIARWIKKNYRIRYVVSEHWSGFLPEASERFSDLPFYLKHSWKKVMNDASGCSTVSSVLAKGVRKHFDSMSPVVIPNVVNVKIFSPDQTDSANLRFVHISGLDELKNPGMILEALKMVLATYPSATLEIYGSKNPEFESLVGNVGLQKQVSIQGEIPQPELARQLAGATALLLYSSYETFGCVVIESGASGVPVIVSDIPVFHETVKVGVTGYFAAPNNPADLAAKMIDIIKNRSMFDSKTISTMTGEKYSYPVVAKQFLAWYQQVIAKI